MAERAKAKKKAASKKKAAPKGAQASRGRVAKTEPKPGIGHNSGKPSPALIKDHHEKISAIETRLAVAKTKYDQVKGELRSAYAVVKQDNIVVDDFKLARELDKRDHGSVVTGYANTGDYLAAIKSELAKVHGLFTDIEVLDAMNATFAGAHAFANGEDRSNNPHQAATEAYVNWDVAWMTAADKKALADGESQTTH